MLRSFRQVDVFTSVPYRGNPLAVVVDADGLTDEEMARFANWTNLSETTFLLPPTVPEADYRVRIFTTDGELPFAGHPTLGSCRVWLDHVGTSDRDTVVQECAAGLVRIRVTGELLAFAAPPLVRSGPVEPSLRATIERVVGVPVLDAAWVDNGPGWVAAEVADVAALLAIRPDFSGAAGLKLGLVARCTTDDTDRYELRAFFPSGGGHVEDPVTGSLNASVAQWLRARDPAPSNPTTLHYTARQGTAIGRAGRIHVTIDDDTIWIGGEVATCISGSVEL